MNLAKPSYFTNRELSWLEFNSRVLEEAMDESVPLLERLGFISIVSSNLDEFFMVRIAGLKEQVDAGLETVDAAGLSPAKQLTLASERIHEMVSMQYKCYTDLLTDLITAGIKIIDYGNLDEIQTEYISDYFDDIIMPVLTPMAIDAGRPFPFIAGNSVNIVFILERDGARNYAIVRVPGVIPRIIKIPDGLQGETYIFIESIIIQRAAELFKGYDILGSTCFRVTRDADLSIDEDDVSDLLFEIEQQVRQRQWGSPVRLELSRNCDRETRTFLRSSLGISESDTYYIDGPIDLSVMMSFKNRINGYDVLKYPEQPPLSVPALAKGSMFKAISGKDHMVHLPYQSFDCVQDFLNEAADDPDVLAIKQVLYRVSGDSPIVETLIRAARNQKQVTVLVELKARFDEENNITWAKKLERAGCHVIYGIRGLKVHSKVLLVIRREPDGIKRYVHLATGNYNDKTARIYTDLGFFTCRESIASDASSLFNNLTGYTLLPEMKKLAASPDGIRTFIYKSIDNEMRNASEGLPAAITIKANSLSDTDMIKKLYEASSAGVDIKLIIRGICCLRPGIRKVSANIRVKSIVGRYLEHSRIYCFENNGNPSFYIGSSDMMERNLDRRVETIFPIEDPGLRQRLTEILEIHWNETDKSRWLKSDGKYSKPEKSGKESQVLLYEYYKNLIKSDHS
ncbi:MAG TPA: polyphosphate kinase 1 [Clostridia bacterium]|nr:polyphosphate kinase 1 [Clostridia bacterium]HPQ46559.1 polyphosphate kinase 1 [Clostridia bacterium]